MALREEVLRREDPGGDYPEPDGDLLRVMENKGDRLVVLTRVGDAASSSDEAAEAEDEPDDDYPTNDDGEPLCVGKEDGQCGNTVDEPGGTCWHHED